MKFKLMIFIIFIGIANCAEVSNNNIDKSNKKLLAHYMPWYMSKPFSDRWGWHWTMNHYNPDEIQPNGQRKIASHYYPIIGPYDSGDPDLLECQTLLMKFAGIDGIIIDWYGIKDFYDYDIINRNTQKIIKFLEKAGLKFAICYEDQSIKHMVNEGHISGQEAIKHGQETMLWLQENFFNNQNYLKTESAKYWLSVLTDIKNRGVKDILIITSDNLPGIQDAIKAVYPESVYQGCVVHLIRNTLRYVSYKDIKAFSSDMKFIYKAPTEESALKAFDELKSIRGKEYPLAVGIWERNWNRISAMYRFTEEIRKLIYTTNAIESIHS
ncbi:TPA: hypothetical protein ENX78_17590, partial [Candidatus Poribacteria bacterium]|nr:hypothetical protein [Candidatus Poribacteria bacterium]